MFELIVGYYYQQIGCKYLTIGKKIQIPDIGAENELDILIEMLNQHLKPPLDY